MKNHSGSVNISFIFVVIKENILKFISRTMIFIHMFARIFTTVQDDRNIFESRIQFLFGLSRIYLKIIKFLGFSVILFWLRFFAQNIHWKTCFSHLQKAIKPLFYRITGQRSLGRQPVLHLCLTFVLYIRDLHSCSFAFVLFIRDLHSCLAFVLYILLWVSPCCKCLCE